MHALTAHLQKDMASRPYDRPTFRVMAPLDCCWWHSP